ncbi:MAG TPA: helix-turn-helix transcriptional regulator [Ktedonobacterales bacterium]
MAALSRRERQVLRLLARGYDNQRIAAVLSIAEGTVKNHVTNMYEHLDVRTRVEAAA